MMPSKEEWNDSTVSSNIAKLRMQHRQEATTRRERALAYAFSQQLRTCTSKKKQAQSDSRQPNLGMELVREVDGNLPARILC
ncbi:protein IQ-DOMAIN 33-like [Aristolochia californica]|uniref:protein IQ-DOMAIN 33-like n=1 Tax=Aristolochia californica TaxID=171875 RepID=UPI0035D72058